MSKTTSPSAKEQEAIRREKLLQRRTMRRQLIGAIAIFAATFLLWEVGGVLPPNLALREVASAQEVFAQEDDLFIAPAIADPADADDAHALLADDDLEPLVQSSVAAVQEAALIPSTEREEQSAPEAEKGAVSDDNGAVGYAVQIGAFKQPHSVQAVVDKLEQNGFTVRQELIERDRQALWRVQVISYATREQAQRQQQALEKLGYQDTHIVHLANTDDGAAPAQREE